MCRDMGYTAPEHILRVLESPGAGIEIPEELAGRARKAVVRMTEIG